MAEQVKLCRDCKYYKKDWSPISALFGDSYDECTHPRVTGDVVNGRITVYCKTARNYLCGHSGEFWEKRK